MQPRDRASLLDILEQIRVIRDHLTGITRENFLSDMLRQDAVMRRIGVIGEASTRLSEEFRDEHPEIPWRKIRAMRNFLIHVYDQVEYDQVWDTVQHDLTPLQRAVDAILAADTSGAE